MDECEHGSDPETCNVCRPVKKVAPTVEYQFEAKYPGNCGVCYERFDEGEPLYRLTNGDIACDTCASLLPPQPLQGKGAFDFE